MVGMLGCGCCGGGGGGKDEPPYYGPCDCGTIEAFLRGDYSLSWEDGKIPDAPMFNRPGPLNTNGPFTYIDWIYNGRFHLTCKRQWNNTIYAPSWSGYESRNATFIGGPFGVARTFGQFNSKYSRFNTQFCWNEFDYEYEWEFCFESNCKPNTTRAYVERQEAWGLTAEIQFFDTNATTNTQIPFTNGLFVGNISKYFSWFANQLTPVNENRLVMYDWFNPPYDRYNNFPAKPIRFLEYDKIYKLKKRMTSTAKIPFDSGILSIQWLLDGEPVSSYTNYLQTIFSSAQWKGCIPGVSRYLHCGWVDVSGFVDAYSLFTNNPASSVWVDNFVFNPIPK